jgi:hypothetical protein
MFDYSCPRKREKWLADLGNCATDAEIPVIAKYVDDILSTRIFQRVSNTSGDGPSILPLSANHIPSHWSGSTATDTTPLSRDWELMG